MAKNVAAGESGFTGGAFENFFRSWVVGFVSVITLSLAYPAMRSAIPPITTASALYSTVRAVSFSACT